MVDETDLNKARSQTGQAFSILGQAQGAEYKRRRKEMEDYNKKMMRDKFKYGLISAAISPAVQAFGQSATDFAGDLLFGQEEDFFIDTEQGRIAAAKSSINSKNLAALEKTKANIDAEGAKVGSVQKYGTDLILKARQEALSGRSGGADPDGIITDEYIRNPEQQKSAEIEWNKQYKELTDSIKTLKAAPTLAEMQAVRKKTVLGQSRGRRAFGRTLAWLKGKDYDRDIRDPAIQKILTGGIPEQSDEWYKATTEEITNNYLKGANVVEGLDKFTDDLMKKNPELGARLEQELTTRKENASTLRAVRSGNIEFLVNTARLTKAQAEVAVKNPPSGNIPLNSFQLDKMIRDDMNKNMSDLVLNSTSSQHKAAGVTFFSLDHNSDTLDKLREEVFQGVVASNGKGLPTATYKEFQGSASKPGEKALLKAVDEKIANLGVQISNEAERLLLQNMANNPENYTFEGNIPKGQSYVAQRKYEFMQLVLNEGLASDVLSVEDEDKSSFFDVKVKDINLLNGNLNRLDDEEQVDEIKEMVEVDTNPGGVTAEALAAENATNNANTSIPEEPKQRKTLPQEIKAVEETFQQQFKKDPSAAIVEVENFIKVKNIPISSLSKDIQNKLSTTTTIDVEGEQPTTSLKSLLAGEVGDSKTKNTFTLKAEPATFGSEVEVDYEFKGGRDAEGRRTDETLNFTAIPEGKVKEKIKEKGNKYYANVAKMKDLGMTDDEIYGRSLYGLTKKAKQLKLANKRLVSDVDLPGLFDTEDVLSLFAQTQFGDS